MILYPALSIGEWVSARARPPSLLNPHYEKGLATNPAWWEAVFGERPTWSANAARGLFQVGPGAGPWPIHAWHSQKFLEPRRYSPKKGHFRCRAKLSPSGMPMGSPPPARGVCQCWACLGTHFRQPRPTAVRDKTYPTWSAPPDHGRLTQLHNWVLYILVKWLFSLQKPGVIYLMFLELGRLPCSKFGTMWFNFV